MASGADIKAPDLGPMRIFVDADACPVKDEAVRVGERHQLKVIFVSNAWMRLPASFVVERVVVPEGPDIADDWIAERAGLRDIVVTSDIPLAARAVKAGAEVVTGVGKRLGDKNIGPILASRDLMAHLRETGVIQSAVPAFRRQDRSQFLQSLEAAIQDIKRRTTSL